MAGEIDYLNGWTNYGGAWRNNSNGMQMSNDDYNRSAQEQSGRMAKENEAAANHTRMAAQGLGDDGSPIRQAFDTLVDPSSGRLKDGYTLNTQALDPTQWEGYSKYKNEALRTGPSAWAGLQNQTVNNQMMGNKEAAARQAMSSMNQGNSALAMRGGSSAGARGLAARSSGRDLLNARQTAQRAGDTNLLGVATTDESNRVGQLANLATTEQSIGTYNNTLDAKTKEYNINNMMHENDAKRSYNDLTYTEQMKKWAADKQAQATANSGGGK